MLKLLLLLVVVGVVGLVRLAAGGSRRWMAWGPAAATMALPPAADRIAYRLCNSAVSNGRSTCHG